MSFLDSLWTRLKRRAFAVCLAIVLGVLIMVNNEGSGRFYMGHHLHCRHYAVGVTC